MEQGHTSNPGLLANLVSRVILAFSGILVSWVPFRLLVRNGEFAAVVFIVDVAIMNLTTIINAIIWHDDDWSTWWDGTGLCDIEVYLSVPLQTIYAASIFAIMYHLAQQVKITRVARDRRDRIRRNIVQAAIIFPIPVFQLIFTWFDLAQRYIIGTLIGCSAVYDSSLPKLLVYDVPAAVFALLAVPYAVLLWRRYDAITKQTRGFLRSDSEISIRANRTRRRLYNMSLSILVVYVPVMIYFLACNVKDTVSSYKAYDYHRMHWSATPYPWDTILFVPSWLIPSEIMNQPWVAIATTIVIVAFFGTTMDAQQMYRQYSQNVGLQSFLHKLKLGKKRDPSPVNESDGSRGSRKKLLPKSTKDSKEHHLFSLVPDSRKPAIQQPDTARKAKAKSQAPWLSRTGINTPPVIPPRYSSLRPRFTLRTPTLRSMRHSLRIPSLRSRTPSSADANDAGNKTTGNATDLNHGDSIPMLPLYSTPKADSWRDSDSILVSDTPEANWRLERPLQVRQVAHQRSTLNMRRGNDAGMVRAREVENTSFPREPTFASVYTASDAWTDISDDIGAAH